MIKEIVLNGKRIEYELQRKNVKNINLRIKSDRTIFVSANPRVSEKVIEEFIEFSKHLHIMKSLPNMLLNRNNLWMEKRLEYLVMIED